MSQQISANSGNTPSAPQKQGFNVYSMMLILSFIALITGASLLASELSKYGAFPQWNTSEARSTGAGS